VKGRTAWAPAGTEAKARPLPARAAMARALKGLGRALMLIG
jgi:hypothetical protein